MNMDFIEIIEKKIIPRERLAVVSAKHHILRHKIVFTNGCFDLLHRGHLYLLSKAAALGDILFVAINSDASIKKLNKGHERPILDEKTRALILASLCFVDYVHIFDEETPEEVIKIIKPQVLVKGSDYTEETIVGASFVKNNGGEVVIIPLLHGFSTTSLVNKIKEKSRT